MTSPSLSCSSKLKPTYLLSTESDKQTYLTKPPLLTNYKNMQGCLIIWLKKTLNISLLKICKMQGFYL